MKNCDAYKLCTQCNKDKPVEDFYSRRDRIKTKHTSACKECRKTFARFKHDPEKQRAYKLKINFDLTVEDYESMLTEQGGTCAICKSEEIVRASNGKLRNLAVDHCHVTGKIRGLLCGSCNKALGLFRDSPEVLLHATNYLLRHKVEEKL